MLSMYCPNDRMFTGRLPALGTDHHSLPCTLLVYWSFAPQCIHRCSQAGCQVGTEALTSLVGWGARGAGSARPSSCAVQCAPVCCIAMCARLHTWWYRSAPLLGPTLRGNSCYVFPKIGYWPVKIILVFFYSLSESRPKVFRSFQCSLGETFIFFAKIFLVAITEEKSVIKHPDKWGEEPNVNGPYLKTALLKNLQKSTKTKHNNEFKKRIFLPVLPSLVTVVPL